MSDATPRTEVINQIFLRLGGGMVDVELDPEHYDVAVDAGISRLREYSSGATEEQFMPLTIEPGVNQYHLPDDVMAVRKVCRRALTHSGGGGTEFDPFDAAFKNAYLLQGGRTGGVATWEMFNMYKETIQKIFVGEMDFIWHPGSKNLELIRNPRHREDIILNVYILKSENALLTDPLTRSWIRAWGLAECKEMLGRARGKYPSGLPGPSGTITMDGDQLISESREDKAALIQQLKQLRTSTTGLPFIIG